MKFLDKYFVFSSSEKRGVYLFLIIIFVMCVVYWLMPKLLKPSPTDFSELKAQLQSSSKSGDVEINETTLFYFNPNKISKDSLELLGFSNKQAWNMVNFRSKVKEFDTKQELLKLYSMTDSLYKVIEPFILLEKEISQRDSLLKNKDEDLKPRLFIFNPNDITKDSLVLLGFTSKSAQTLINFRESINGFKSKEELKKVFGVTPDLYQKIEPFISIPSKKSNPEEEPESDLIELNTSTKEDLMSAKGIGAAFSKRIIEHRKNLGGFLSINQLEEVFGIDKDWIVKYGKQFTIDKGKIKKININTIEFKKLLRHPYIEFSEVKRIINYRDMHVKFSSLEQIRDNNLINPEQYRKIVPYLSLE